MKKSILLSLLLLALLISSAFSGDLTTRFPNGVTNVAQNDLFGRLGTLDRTKYFELFDDFAYTAVSMAADRYILTTTGDPVSGVLTSSAIDFGAATITSSASVEAVCSLQSTPAVFTMTAGKEAWFETRFKLSEVTTTKFRIGLSLADAATSFPTVASATGVYFSKADSSTTILIYNNAVSSSVSSISASLSTSLTSLAADTYLTLGWHYDGVSEIGYYINGVKAGHISGATIPGSPLVFTADFGNSNASKTFTIDYFWAIKER